MNDIKKILIKIFNNLRTKKITKLNDDSIISDIYEFDLLDKIEIIMDMEDKFGIIIHDDECDNLIYFKDYVNLVNDKLIKK